jgi:hypothetical protein
MTVSGLTDSQAANLSAALGGNAASYFESPPAVASVTSTGTSGQYAVVLTITGTLTSALSSYDSDLTVTVTAGGLSSEPYDVVAIYYCPPN